MEDAIGSAGISRTTWDSALAKTRNGVERIRAAYAQGDWPLLSLPGETSDIDRLKPIAQALIDHSDILLVIGIGGSSLGGRTLCGLGVDQGCRVIFVDTLDGYSFSNIVRNLNLDRTSVVAISKSGTTAETLMQTLAIITAYIAAGMQGQLGRHMLMITSPGDNPMREIAVRYDMPVLDHEPELGGRYSALSAVGLLPAMISGVDAHAVRTGAQGIIEELVSVDDCEAAKGAAATYAMLMSGRGVSVFMPYAERLKDLGYWYVQLVAESLGKNGKGITPIAALGPRDQHSVLQLYLDGPADKMFTFLGETVPEPGPLITREVAKGAAAQYAGKTLGQLVSAEFLATIETLVKKGRPVRVFELASLRPGVMGALMMHFMLETIILGDMLGIDPFDQPAVDEGKRLAEQYLRGT